MFDNIERLCVELNKIAKLITWHTVAVSTFKKDRKTTDNLKMNDELCLLIQELKGQEVDKVISDIKLSHEILVNYKPEKIVKNVAILEFGHVQLINYLNQNLVKEIVEVSL